MLHIVLIPAYKPDNKMTDLARSLFNQGMTVVIVNDGSGAPYNEIFERAELFAHVVRCTRNGGKGAALKTGLAYISDHFAPPYTVTTAPRYAGDRQPHDQPRNADAQLER